MDGWGSWQQDSGEEMIEEDLHERGYEEGVGAERGRQSLCKN